MQAEEARQEGTKRQPQPTVQCAKCSEVSEEAGKGKEVVVVVGAVRAVCAGGGWRHEHVQRGKRCDTGVASVEVRRGRVGGAGVGRW